MKLEFATQKELFVVLNDFGSVKSAPSISCYHRKMTDPIQRAIYPNNGGNFESMGMILKITKDIDVVGTSRKVF